MHGGTRICFKLKNVCNLFCSHFLKVYWTKLVTRSLAQITFSEPDLSTSEIMIDQDGPFRPVRPILVHLGTPIVLWPILKDWEKKSQSSKDGPGLPNTPQNSAEPLRLCGRVLRNLLHCRKPAENPHTEPQRFCRTLGATPSISDPANSSSIGTNNAGVGRLECWSELCFDHGLSVAQGRGLIAVLGGQRLHGQTQGDKLQSAVSCGFLLFLRIPAVSVVFC